MTKISYMTNFSWMTNSLLTDFSWIQFPDKVVLQLQTVFNRMILTNYTFMENNLQPKY